MKTYSRLTLALVLFTMVGCGKSSEKNVAIAAFKQLESLRMNKQLAPFVLECIVVSALEDNLYGIEITAHFADFGGGQAVLRTVSTKYNSKGLAKLGVVSKGAISVQTSSGYELSVPLFEEARSPAGSRTLSTDEVSEAYLELEDKINAQTERVFDALSDSGYTGDDINALAAFLQTAVKDTNKFDLHKMQRKLDEQE